MTEKQTEPKTAAAHLRPELVEAARWCGFTAADGWPAELAHRDIAKLQTYSTDAKAWNSAARTWCDVLALNATSGALSARTEQRHRPTGQFQRIDTANNFASRDWLNRGFAAAYAPEPYSQPTSFVRKRVSTQVYIIAALDLAAWMQAAGHTPSPHVRAWLAARGAVPVPTTQEPTPALQRQAARWQACIDAGLAIDANTFAPLPRGIGRVAKHLRITRQALSEDLRAYREHLATKQA